MNEPESQNDKDDAKQKLIDRLLNLWMHQNELLWGRLQTIAVIQAGVIGGWYYLTFSEHGAIAPCLGFCLTILGCKLSYEVKMLIQRDRDRQFDYDRRIKKLDEYIHKQLFEDFEDRPKNSGRKRIKFISYLFVWVNIFLAMLSGVKVFCIFLVWLYHSCGC